MLEWSTLLALIVVFHNLVCQRNYNSISTSINMQEWKKKMLLSFFPVYALVEFFSLWPWRSHIIHRLFKAALHHIHSSHLRMFMKCSWTGQMVPRKPFIDIQLDFKQRDQHHKNYVPIMSKNTPWDKENEESQHFGDRQKNLPLPSPPRITGFSTSSCSITSKPEADGRKQWGWKNKRKQVAPRSTLAWLLIWTTNLKTSLMEKWKENYSEEIHDGNPYPSTPRSQARKMIGKCSVKIHNLYTYGTFFKIRSIKITFWNICFYSYL